MAMIKLKVTLRKSVIEGISEFQLQCFENILINRFKKMNVLAILDYQGEKSSFKVIENKTGTKENMAVYAEVILSTLKQMASYSKLKTVDVSDNKKRLSF